MPNAMAPPTQRSARSRLPTPTLAATKAASGRAQSEDQRHEQISNRTAVPRPLHPSQQHW